MKDRGSVIPFARKLTALEEGIENDMSNIKLLTGGKEPPADGDWLSKMELGSIFLIQDRISADFNLGHFKLVDKTDKACILASTVLPNPIFVNPVRFCQKYSMYESLGVFKDEDIINNEASEKTEEDNIK